MMAEIVPSPFLARRVAEIAKPGIHNIAERGAEVAKGNAPVDTGEMRDSIHVEDTDEGSQVVVGTDHWIFPEFGTIYMAAEPFMRPLIEELGLNR
jgi:HK97 gp10 family phage protein